MPSRSFRLTSLAFAIAALSVCFASARAEEQLPEVQPLVGAAPKVAEKPIDWSAGPTPKWIWGASDDKNYVLRKTFSLPAGTKATGARVIASVDNVGTVKLNGKTIGSSSEWAQPVTGSGDVKSGENVVEIVAENQGGVAAAALKLQVALEGAEPLWIVSDDSWTAKEMRRDPNVRAEKVRVGADMGAQPWGNVFDGSGGPVADSRAFRVVDGFQVEKLFVVPKETMGSWVSITFDPQGRILASAQEKEGIYRITPSPIGSNEPTKVEKLPLDITSAHGLLCAFGKLYMSINGGPGSGLYVAEDTNSDGEWDAVRKLKSIDGGGEHGPHALRLSPDGKSIYLMSGNHTKVPADFSASRIPTNWNEDLLLPRQWDARGHAVGILAPCGWIAKTDPEGKDWEIFSIGYRNAYDFAFSPEGEIFSYDSDMEWDMGAPWYRPTRVLHSTSGSEFGSRSGAGVWPVWYEDSLPPVVDIGPGSPTGVTFGTGAKFPDKWQRALYCTDWTFGTIYAVHLKPQGSTFVGERMEFVSRAGLPLTDVTIGPDGAMYFTVGGRGTQSELYRVTYVGKEPITTVAGAAEADADELDSAGLAEVRVIRRNIEELHSETKVAPDDKRLALALELLASPDRFIRYASRVAVEKHGMDQLRKWIGKFEPWGQIDGSFALARQGKPEDLKLIVDTLLGLPLAELSVEQQLAAVRAYQVAFARQGRPSSEEAAKVLAQLEPLYPNADKRMDRELSIVLVYLDSPVVIERTIALLAQPTERSEAEVTELLSRNPGYGGSIVAMLKNAPEAEKMQLAYTLRNAKFGWTLDQRRAYFEWLKGAQTKSGGASYEGFIANIRKDAMETLTDAEKVALEDATAAPVYRTEELPKPIGPGKKRDSAQIVEVYKSAKTPRDYAAGKRAYAAAQCVACHRFAGEGGATGPDLTNLVGRFPIQDLADAIALPNKAISDQYQAHQILTADGRNLTGRVLTESPETVTLNVDPIDPTKVVELKRADIEVMRPSKTSLMPEGTIDGLNDEELRDLLAYLLSRGNPNDPAFAK